MAEKNDNELTKIKQIVEIMQENDLVEVEIKRGNEKIFLKRSQPQSTEMPVPMIVPGLAPAPAVAEASEQSAAQGQSAEQQAEQENLVEIKSPIVGTFYSAPSPDSDAYVELGSHVDGQMVVCVVEAMKVMNEIKAETSGTITEILVKTGQAVEYGQVLFKVKPD